MSLKMYLHTKRLLAYHTDILEECKGIVEEGKIHGAK